MVIATEFTLYVTLNVAPLPKALSVVVVTPVDPGNAVYTPVDTTLNVTIAPGVVAVDNTSMTAGPPPEATVPPERVNRSPTL